MDTSALHKIGYGLYVLIAQQGDKDNACIINVAQQVTSDPMQIMICVNKQNLTHDMIIRTAKFNLCPLSEEATMKPFEHFGFQSGRNVNKFENCEVELRSENGLRYLPKYINACFQCVVTKAIDLGTHTMFIAMVMDAKVLSESPSITYAYYQQHIKPKPAIAQTNDSPTTKRRWVCDICGFIYEGDEVPDDFICPICKHPKSDFSLVV